MFPHVVERAVTIPCTLADGYYPERMPRLLPSVVAARQSPAAAVHPSAVIKRLEKTGLPPYLLMVSTIEPRKNHVALIRAYERVLARRDNDLRLIIVGTPGWRFHEALQVMAPLIKRGRLFHLDKVPQAELRVLYSHAEAVVFPSLYEGFGYTPLEAMCCDTPAIASNIAAHRWAYGDAAEYCDPYRVDTIAAAIERVCLDSDAAFRNELIARGRRRAARYRVNGTAAQWQALLTELRRQGITHNARDAKLAEFNEELRRIEREQERFAETESETDQPDVLPFAA
jgi:glycosyltransferase involved in cell wall biosynthesis